MDMSAKPGIRKSTDYLLAQSNTTIEQLLKAEEYWLKTAPPMVRAAYLEQQRDIQMRMYNKLIYGNEEGRVDE